MNSARIPCGEDWQIILQTDFNRFKPSSMLTGNFFTRLGFEISTTPGVSRAWVYEFDNGDYILVTDIGGFDLPEEHAACSALYLSRRSETIEYLDHAETEFDFEQWFSRIKAEFHNI